VVLLEEEPPTDQAGVHQACPHEQGFLPASQVGLLEVGPPLGQVGQDLVTQVLGQAGWVLVTQVLGQAGWVLVTQVGLGKVG
jgi:hypothetical protein